MPDASLLFDLMSVINSRKNASSTESYTARLLAGGLSTVVGKLREECDELIEAAFESDNQAHQHLICEAADTVYHLLVLLAAKEVTWNEVESELGRRFGISGLAEKASRGKSSTE